MSQTTKDYILEDFSNTEKITLIKHEISNACCTSQANNDFYMTVETISIKECVRILCDECLSTIVDIDDECDIDDEDNKEFIKTTKEAINKMLEIGKIKHYASCGESCYTLYIFSKDKKIKASSHEDIEVFENLIEL